MGTKFTAIQDGQPTSACLNLELPTAKFFFILLFLLSLLLLAQPWVLFVAGFLMSKLGDDHI
jgi:hypothetical protein